VFKRLVHFLFRLLNSEGKLVIAFKDKNIPFPSIAPDWLCNWSFITRSENDLMDVAKGLGIDTTSIKIERVGPEKCIMFLVLTKT